MLTFSSCKTEEDSAAVTSSGTGYLPAEIVTTNIYYDGVTDTPVSIDSSTEKMQSYDTPWGVEFAIVANTSESDYEADGISNATYRRTITRDSSATIVLQLDERDDYTKDTATRVQVNTYDPFTKALLGYRATTTSEDSENVEQLTAVYSKNTLEGNSNQYEVLLELNLTGATAGTSSYMGVEKVSRVLHEGMWRETLMVSSLVNSITGEVQDSKKEETTFNSDYQPLTRISSHDSDGDAVYECVFAEETYNYDDRGFINSVYIKADDFCNGSITTISYVYVVKAENSAGYPTLIDLTTTFVNPSGTEMTETTPLIFTTDQAGNILSAEFTEKNSSGKLLYQTETKYTYYNPGTTTATTPAASFKGMNQKAIWPLNQILLDHTKRKKKKVNKGSPMAKFSKFL